MVLVQRSIVKRVVLFFFLMVSSIRCSVRRAFVLAGALRRVEFYRSFESCQIQNECDWVQVAVGHIFLVAFLFVFREDNWFDGDIILFRKE